MQNDVRPEADTERPEVFYVMQEIDGDECLAASRENLEDALLAMVDLAEMIPERDLSVCSTTRGFVAFMKDGAPLLVGQAAVSTREGSPT